MHTYREKAARLANYISELDSDFKLYTEIDGEYDHIGATIADAILQARRDYIRIVKPRVNRILHVYAEARTTSALIDLLRHITVDEFLDFQSAIRAQRFREVLDLLAEEGVEITSDLRQWLTYPESVAKLRAINGIGLKTANYFGILCGLPAVAVDTRLRGFLNRAGISCRNDNEAQRVIELAADLLGYDRAHFDHSIWRHMEPKHDNGQDPHPCRT